MGKPNKKAIERLMAEGVVLSTKISKIQSAHEKELAPYREQVETKKRDCDAAFAALVLEVTGPKAAELQAAEDRLAEIEAELTKEMRLGIQGNDVAIHAIEHKGAKVTVEQTKADATVEPSLFLATVPEAERDAQFWDCLKVQIQNARKLLGKKFEQISQVKKHFAVKIAWK